MLTSERVLPTVKESDWAVMTENQEDPAALHSELCGPGTEDFSELEVLNQFGQKERTHLRVHLIWLCLSLSHGLDLSLGLGFRVKKPEHQGV